MTRAAADAGAVRRGLVLIAAIWVAVACAAAAGVATDGPRRTSRSPRSRCPTAPCRRCSRPTATSCWSGCTGPRPPSRRGWSGAARTARSRRSRPRPITGYGRTASWFSLAADGTRILAIGGEAGGGAHGNVRWSVWSGSASGVAEHAQAFSTFGGWGAGDLIDAVLTPGSSAVVGSWESAEAGLDVAVWTPEGDDWVRRPSTGTPLQSTRAEVAFPTAATGFGPGVVVAGWQVGTGAGGGQVPVVWRSGPDAAGWDKAVLPDAGKAGTAKAIRCANATCAVAGTADGALALWRLVDGRWSRVRASRRSRSATPTGSPPRSTRTGRSSRSSPTGAR